MIRIRAVAGRHPILAIVVAIVALTVAALVLAQVGGGGHGIMRLL